MHRTDAPQCEKTEMVLHQTPPEFETSVDFVPLDPGRQRDIHRERENVSGEVPPPTARQQGPKHVATEQYGNLVPMQSLIQAWISMSLRVRSPTSESSSTL